MNTTVESDWGVKRLDGAFLRERPARPKGQRQTCVSSRRRGNILVPGKSLEMVGECAFDLSDN